MKVLTAMLGAAMLLLALPAQANQDEFCAGFVQGYRSAKGDKGAVPACPVAPATSVGSTPFRDGIKAGLRAARKS